MIPKLEERGMLQSLWDEKESVRLLFVENCLNSEPSKLWKGCSHHLLSLPNVGSTHWREAGLVERKEGRIFGEETIEVETWVSPSPRVALCRIDNGEPPTLVSVKTPWWLPFKQANLDLIDDSNILVRGYVPLYLRIRGLKNSHMKNYIQASWVHKYIS